MLNIPPVIGLVGHGGTGKSTGIANYLRDKYFYEGDHIKAPLMDLATVMIVHMFRDMSDDEILRRLDGSVADKEEPFPEPWSHTCGRKLLQGFGKEGRDATIGQDGLLELWYSRNGAGKVPLVNERVLYQHETEWFRAKGGIIIKVDREGCGPASGSAGTHISEQSQPDFDYHIQNDYDSYAPLHQLVDRVLQHFSEYGGRPGLPVYL